MFLFIYLFIFLLTFYFCRTEHDAVEKTKGEVKYETVKALNEWDPRVSK